MAMTAPHLTPALHAKVGDLIQTHRGQLFRVTKVKQVNYGVVDEDGKNWNLRKTGAFEAPEGAIFAGPEAPARSYAALVEEIEIAKPMHAGTVVVFNDGGKYDDGTKYVILRDNGSTVSMAKLGGDNGRYIRGAGKSRLTVVEV